ncbi:hypothetical protein GGX14DRAFT_563147 [Mycena pura]|uniref:Uncharacterized protein n=1 Tax=Mycena pura TaxID=153505 RepID=A0AAD6YFJ5_9AGAR|nr:hypothetical protein GGX14DRAFT_563147 [Mycena pura]
MERRYVPADFAHVRRATLIECVKRQIDKWPTDRLGKFKNKANMDTMRSALLAEPFTTTKPLPSMPGLVAGPSNPTQPSQSTVRSGLAVGQQNSATLCEHRSLQLLIKDTRLTLETASSRVSQRVQISVVGYASGSWLASSRELFMALQASISAIQGPARLGVPDLRNEGYQVLFAIIDGPEDEIIYGENILPIPDSNVLQLFVSSVNSAPQLTQMPSSSSKTSSSKAMKDKPAIPLTDAEFKFLDDLVKRTPGCDAFRGKHNQRLVNLARVQFWRFAAGYCEKYHKTSWPAEIVDRSGTSRTVSKAAIETVLGLGQTALNEAIQMAQILSVYYDEGPHRSEEVVQMVETTAGTADKVDDSGAAAESDYDDGKVKELRRRLTRAKRAVRKKGKKSTVTVETHTKFVVDEDIDMRAPGLKALLTDATPDSVARTEGDIIDVDGHMDVDWNDEALWNDWIDAGHSTRTFGPI